MRSVPPSPSTSTRANVLVALVLVVGTLALWAPSLRGGFLHFDDPEYVTANPHVRDGLTLDGAVWAFTRSHSANWHPVTWLSHMLDCALFGLDARGHHATNVVVHALAAAVLFLALFALTGARWPAAFVAVLFAVHPLRVESVAWISERKDVLCGLFWFLTLLAWAHYARRPGVGRYLVALLCFALGLSSKPMLVTLPCVLLLLDAWPLRRWRGCRSAPRFETGGGPRSAGQLVAEKLPLFALSAITSVVTVLVQSSFGAVRTLATIPPDVRVANALRSYALYLWRTLWPHDLAIFYPHPGLRAGFGLASPEVLVSMLVLALLTLLSVGARRRAPWLLVGWLWYLGTLFPVSGLFQAGEHALADRFTYGPIVGVYVMVAWSGAALVAALPALRVPSIVAATLAVAAYAAVTLATLSHWRSAEEVWRQALRVTDGNALAHYQLGIELESGGDRQGALAEYDAAIALRPDYVDARYNRGVVLLDLGRFDQAAESLGEAVARAPELVDGWVNLGIAQARGGRLAEAERSLGRALALAPEHARAHGNLAGVHLSAGRLAEAESEAREALRLDPRLVAARYSLGLVQVRQGRRDDARASFAEVLRAEPAHAAARRALGELGE